MSRLALLPQLLGACCIIAGLYGALHNQISYTVSPEYFTTFKFRQFEVPDSIRNRFGAAIVGWSASWWMGIVIGPPLLLVALWHRNPTAYVRHTLRAFAVVAFTALIFGLGALAWASATLTPDNLPHFMARHKVDDPVAFARAGTMHNASYLGGLAGVLTGTAYLIVARLRRKGPAG